MENISNGILPLTNKPLKVLKQKHPETNKLPQKVLLQGMTRPVHPILYEDMNEHKRIQNPFKHLRWIVIA